MRPVLFAALLFLAACQTSRATTLDTPRARVTECQQLCSDVGLEMSAMVVIMNSSGCVCAVPQGAKDDLATASSAVSGGAVITAAIQAQQRAAQQQQASRPVYAK